MCYPDTSGLLPLVSSSLLNVQPLDSHFAGLNPTHHLSKIRILDDFRVSRIGIQACICHACIIDFGVPPPLLGDKYAECQSRNSE